METLRPRVAAEVDLKAIKHNYKQIKNHLAKNVEIMAVIKADGYGHGALKLADVYLEEGVSRFAVATADEGIELRRHGVKLPILVLGYTPKSDLRRLVENHLTATVYSYEVAEYVNEIGESLKVKADIHIKVDTGMGRIGFRYNEESIEEVKKISKLPFINIEGLFTHFSTADEEQTAYTHKQWELFNAFINDLKKEGINPPTIHAANSAAIMCHDYTHLNMVRPGIILYGHYPSDYLEKKVLDLKPAMTLKSQVVHIKELDEGEYIGYGRKFCTHQKTKIATIPIGYADGYSRCLSGKARVLIHGQYAPVIGNICMDQCMVDVSHIEDVAIEDEVVIFGRQQENEIAVEELAGLLGTISYEVICMIGKRVPRTYIE